MMAGRRVIVALWLLGMLTGCVVIMRTTFSADMSAFLPRSPPPAQRILVDQLREGVVSRLILLAIEGAPPDTLAELSKAVAGDLRADPAFGVVSNGDEAAFARDRDLLWRNRYLLSPAIVPGHFSPAALHAALQADVQLLGSDMGMLVKQSVPADPTGEMLRLIDALAGQARPATHDGVWISPDSRRALLMVQTVAAGFDLDAQEQALHRIDTAFAEARRAVPAGMRTEAAQARLIATGPPVFAVQTRAQMKSDVMRLSLIATLLVAAILLFAYRSVRMLALGLLPVLSGVIAGIAGVSLAFGFVHGITLGFGVTLIGEAVDYAIYLLTQTAPGAATAETLPRIWPTLRLGMLTSVCGFSAMLLSSFTGFAQLGLFTITGLIVALAVTRWVLPALLPRSFATTGSLVFAVPVLALIRGGATLRFVVLGLTIVAALALVFHHGPYWDDELDSMSPLPAGEKSLDEQLRREIGAPDVRYLVVVQAPDREAALVASERVAARLEPLVAKGAIAGFDAPVTWLPSEATQRARQAVLPDAVTLEANMAHAIDGTPFRSDIFTPFLADVAAARRQPLLQREDLNGTSLALSVDSLLVRASGRWVAILPLRGVSASGAVAGGAVAETVAGMDDKRLVFLDLKAESDRLLGSYLHEALTLSLAGSVAIAALLSISLRSLWRTAAVLLPLAAAVICTAALLLTVAGRLSIFNLFGLLLVAAVGSNYCLFFERASRDADDLARRRLVASLVIADLCTVIGFGILSFSAIPVLHGIGLTVAIGACLSLLFGAILNTGRGSPVRVNAAPRGL
jgi:predicted exporter